MDRGGTVVLWNRGSIVDVALSICHRNMFATSWQAVLNFFPKVNDKSFIICPAAVSALEIATDFNVIQYNDCRICPKTPSNTQYTIEAHFFGHFLIKTKHDQVPQSYVHEKTCPHSSRFWYDFGLNIFSATFFRDTLYLVSIFYWPACYYSDNLKLSMFHAWCM